MEASPHSCNHAIYEAVVCGDSFLDLPVDGPATRKPARRLPAVDIDITPLNLPTAQWGWAEWGFSAWGLGQRVSCR